MRENTIDYIVSKFGNQTELAKLLGINQSAISQWKKAGLIPSRRQKTILDVAKTQGIDLKPSDFFEAGSAIDNPQPPP